MNTTNKNFDDNDEDMSVTSSEQDIDLSQFNRNDGFDYGTQQDASSVEDYDGRSDVGKRKGFSNGNKPLMLMLILMAIGLSAYAIYYISNMSMGVKGDVVEEEAPSNIQDAQSSKDFNKEFEQMQAYDAQQAANAELLAQNPSLAGQPIAPIDAQPALDGQPNGYQPTPVNPQYTDTGYQTGQMPVAVEKPLSPEEARIQRVLGSSFGGSGTPSASKANTDNAADGEGEGEGEENSKSNSGLSSRMNNVSVFASTKAGKMGNRDYMLDKGSFIECVLITRFNSQLAGMLTCETTRNIYSSSGRVILINRGSRVTGQYQGDIENGQSRVFVMWDRIVTPQGVGINIASAGTSPLGESGLAGRLNTHFWRNLSTAFMVSLVGATADATGEAVGDAIGRKLDRALGNTSGTSKVDINSGSGSSSPSEVSVKVLDKLGTTKPTVTKNQGDRVTIYVARDVDFSGVYSLK